MTMVRLHTDNVRQVRMNRYQRRIDWRLILLLVLIVLTAVSTGALLYTNHLREAAVARVLG